MCIETKRFVKILHRDLRCPICLGALCINSVFDENEHAYCKTCILGWLKTGSKNCPLGNEEISKENLKPVTRIIRNLLSDLDIYCKYKQDGCTAVIKYEKMSDHEVQCAYNPRNDPTRCKFDLKSPLIGTKIKSSKIIDFPNNELYRMSLINDGTNVILTNETTGQLCTYDLNGTLLDSINPDFRLSEPLGICVCCYNNNEEIVVGDVKENKIFVFDSNFNYKRSFGDKNLFEPQYLACDTSCNDGKCYLYISNISSNYITVWDIMTGQFIRKINIDFPRGIQFTSDKIFVESPVTFESDKNNENKVEKIKKGSNCVFVLDKEKFEIIETIKFDDWLSPCGLHIDLNMNMCLIAYNLNKDNEKSEFRYLYFIDSNHNIKNKIVLNNVKAIADMVYVGNKILISTSEKLIIFELE